MNKKDLVNLISERTDLDKVVVLTVMSEVNKAIIESLSKCEEVKIAGFGTFYTKKREARKGRNPKTGEIIQIKEANIPKFRPGKNMKDI